MDVTIRPATASDIGFLTEVEFRSGFGEWTAEQVRGELDGSTTSVVLVDGGDAGRLRVVRRRDLVEIAGVQLLPEHRLRLT